jgi:hypothetical protein
MPKARALAAMFGTDEEEELPTLPPEELSLEDIADADPTEADLKEPAE